MTLLPLETAEDLRQALPAVAAHLHRGGLLAYPTETVYGLGSRPRDADVAALAALKGRQREKPFLLLVSNRRMAELHGLVFTEAANALAAAFWPGPLTLVLAGGEGRLPDMLRGPEGGIAVRWTSHPAMAQLIEALGHPLTSTSANLPGGPTAPGAAAIAATFTAAVANGTLLVLDGGTLGNVPPSTVVDCTRPQPRLIRDGAIPKTELRRRAGSAAP
ncbi:MAG TPA: L-threonylcarbamoyladenylate synthase [Gemmatimonadales bacterium]|jgi:L-threonylcarbamoyladenylate synthase|nr:L-threonylcarbamoyladenylate synthase [Gemmatimonadales bacterium]